MSKLNENNNVTNKREREKRNQQYVAEKRHEIYEKIHP